MLHKTRLVLGLSAVLILAGGSAFLVSRSRSRTEDQVPYNGDFNNTTLDHIWKDISQWNVRTRAQNHKVYVITGGLGVPDPTIMQADSNGNFTFAVGDSPGVQYRFYELGDSPNNWIYNGSDIITAPGKVPPQSHRVPWVKRTTESGQTYFEWDMSKSSKYYYFRRGNTYITLYEWTTHPNASVPSFPVGVFTHLAVLNNPVS
ncbi:hypothetical protein [Alicyclobacillus sp. SO9]|uniref:hypothetical protein n=1 Tax=Alicyclobacillus sp. SO9 TaxID=2665646 RepID=UPI0018E8AEB8|nr:hypothetical protein [Alicyclobacillus sp. SO9]QQE78899.1 hypothetical protein GI364_24220 [Alicyclobacillus sp. SO9]